jgi:hypothetical protein
MTRTTEKNAILASLKHRLHLVAFLTISALVLYAVFAPGTTEKRFVSSEVRFADRSLGGAMIVPASCPSHPHYAGECGAGGGGGSTIDENTPPPEPDGNACVIAFSPATIVSGQSAFLGWSSHFDIFGIEFEMTGTIDPGVDGTLAGSGVTTVSPSQTTTYTGVFTPVGSVEGIPQSWLTPVVCSGTLNVLSSQPGTGNCSVVNFCDGNNLYQQKANCSNVLLQQCPYGCSAGACILPAPPDAFIRAAPALVRTGETTNITWGSSNSSSCSVSGTNGDSWSGKNGSETTSEITTQTTYTLICTGLDSSEVTDTAIVNVIPIFEET